MKKKDWILIFVILFISFVVLLGYRYFYQDEGNMVEIQKDQEIYGTYPLSENRVIEIEENGMYNRIVIEDGTVRIVEADCKDQTCVKQKPITLSGETIICLPNRVTVRIISEKQSELDGVTY